MESQSCFSQEHKRMSRDETQFHSIITIEI